MPSEPVDTPTIALYPFRFLDPVSGRWVRARYRAERHVIEQRYAKWWIIDETVV